MHRHQKIFIKDLCFEWLQYGGVFNVQNPVVFISLLSLGGFFWGGGQKCLLEVLSRVCSYS